MTITRTSLLAFSASLALSATAQVTGPSSSKSPYMLPVAAGVVTKSVFTVGDTVGGYRMVGAPDGLGGFSNGNGTFSLFMNHELTPTSGIVRAHGATGAFVSRWTIDSGTLAVTSGRDQITTVMGVAGGAAPFGRFCSANLAPTSAFFNSSTGLGTQNRIFMNGEETGGEGRAFGHVLTGSADGTTRFLPHLGRANFENQVANPFAQNKTIVLGTDDTTPGQVYMYIGDKSASGDDFDKAGLVGGNLFGIKVAGNAVENRTTGISSGTSFSLASFGNVSGITGASLQTQSVANGVTEFLRPEDICWDPNNPAKAYFLTTDRFDQVKAGTGTQVGRTRLWRLNFNDITNPTSGGTIDMLLDGTEAETQMLDNLTVDKFGNVLMQEDTGNNSHLTKVWMYKPDGSLIKVAQADASRFSTGGSQFLTLDEENSGIIDASDLLGDGWYMYTLMAHYGISGELVEGGQLIAMYVPDAVPEPATVAVAAMGLAALATRRKRRVK